MFRIKANIIIQIRLLIVDSLQFPFGNIITGAKVSLAILHVLTPTRDFLTQIFNYTQPWHAALVHAPGKQHKISDSLL